MLLSLNRRPNSRHRTGRRLAHQLLDQRQMLAGDVELVRDDVRLQQNAGQVSLDVLANDRFSADYDGARLITNVSTGSRGGQIRIDQGGGSLRYTPPANFVGAESFEYYVDGEQSAQVHVTVDTPVPDFQRVVRRLADEYQFDLVHDANFPDDYLGQRKITLLGLSSLGSELSLSEDGQSISYRPLTGVSGTDVFTFIVDDRFSAVARIEIENVLGADQFEVLQHSGSTELDLLRNDFQGQGNQVAGLAEDSTITHVLPASDQFSVQIADDGRAVLLAPIDDFSGYASFRYVVNGRFEQHVSVRVIRPVRDDYLSADENGGPHTFDVLANDYYDYDNRIDIIDVVTEVEQGDAGGVVVISNDGRTITYTPPIDFTGAETFYYTADHTYQARVRVQVSKPVRDDSQVVYIDTESRIDVLANDFHRDQTIPATITSVGTSQIGGTIRIGDDGLIHYTPPVEVEAHQTRDQFEYTVNDAQAATVRLWFGSITTPDRVHVDRPLALTVDVLENDHFREGYQGEGRITGVSTPSDGGTVTISENGTQLNYTPGSDRETFEYTVDGRYTETVTAVPIGRLSHDRGVADQNGDPIVVNVLENDFDSTWIQREYGRYQGDRIVTAVTPTEAGGTVEILANHAVRYTPPKDFVGADRFEYTVDAFLASSVVIHVIRRADDDVVRVDPNSRDNELKVLVNDLLGADYWGPGVITAVDGAAGSLRLATSGESVFYTPPPDFVGTDQFVYTVDGRSKATVTVHVKSQREDALPQFESVEQLRDHLLELSVDRWYGANRSVEVADLASSTLATASLSYSETNVQVAGVDEDDLVETDGQYIYTLHGNQVSIVRALDDGNLEWMSQTPIEGRPIGMYLNGDRLAVVSRLYDELDFPWEDRLSLDPVPIQTDWIRPWPTDATTVVTVLDVGDRANPSLVHQTEMDGDYLSSRRIDDQVFLVLNSGTLLFTPQTLCDPDHGCIRETREEFIARVENDYAQLLEEMLPSYQSVGLGGDVVRGGGLVVPEDIFVSGSDSASMTVVVSLNMSTTEPGLGSTSGVLTGSGGTTYATTDSLYVFKPDRDPQDGQPGTQILKFDWESKLGGIEFAATGYVAGRVLNQFSADQQGEILRITTSISNSGTGNFSGNPETGIFTLQDDHGVLEFVGSLQNVAPGENVKSVRYFGDRAFVTTFRQIDPLFAIDLSDPADPAVMGHVSIAGFSNYAQVISPDRLLTVGTDQGTAIVSLFDIRDFANPTLVDLYPLPRRTTSLANLDHHAFGWFSTHEILAIPTGQHLYERWDADNDGYREATRYVRRDALTMLRIGPGDEAREESISLRGRIDHDAQVIRTVYIGDYIYSVGLDAVRSVQVGAEDIVVGEVGLPSELDPRPLPFVADTLSEVGKAARQMHVDHQGSEPGHLMIVAQESTAGIYDTVLRVGEHHFRYRGEDADHLRLVDDAFAFDQDWQNAENRWDVNNDGQVSAVDALVAINAIGQRNGRDLAADRVMRQVQSVTKYFDVNGDGVLSAVDALNVINRLALSEGQASGAESSGSEPAQNQIVGLETGSARSDEEERDYDPRVSTIRSDPADKI